MIVSSVLHHLGTSVKIRTLSEKWSSIAHESAEPWPPGVLVAPPSVRHKGGLGWRTVSGRKEFLLAWPRRRLSSSLTN